MINPGTEITLLIVLIVLILISAFFSSSETGMMAMNRYRLRHLANSGHRTARRAQKLLERPDRLLGIILIGNTLSNVLASSIATFMAVHFWGNLGVAIATVALTVLLLIFAETMPKTFAAVHSQRVTFLVTWPLTLLLWIFFPLVWVMNTIVNTTLLLFKIRVDEKQEDNLSSEELRTIVYESGSIIPKRHRTMILGLLDLEKITVEDIMTPRNEILGVNLEDEWEDILDLLSDTTELRLPVYEGNIDNVQGVLSVRNVVHLMADKNFNKETLRNILVAPYFVPESTSLIAQITQFQQKHCYYALVVDEYGDIQGSVTLPGILEEIVGEFVMKHGAKSQHVHAQEDGSYLVDASATLRELEKAMSWKLPSKGPKTLSGLVVEQLEAAPQPYVGIKIAGYAIEILQVKDNIIKSVRVWPPKKLEKS